MITRRSLFGVLAGAVAAPIVVRSVAVVAPPVGEWLPDDAQIIFSEPRIQRFTYIGDPVILA